MSRINPVEPGQASKKSAALLESVNKAIGMTPNILATIGHSSAALEGYLGFSKALGGTSLSAGLREQIALAVGAANGCEYCVSAHTASGKGAGLNDEDLASALRGQSNDPKTEAALRFALAIVEKRGWVDDEDVAAVRAVGFGDAEVVEIIAVVSLNIFTNYFNHVADTEIDFPRVTIPAGAGV